MKKLASIAVILLFLTGYNSKNIVNNGGNKQGNTNNDVVEQKMTCTLHTNDVVNNTYTKMNESYGGYTYSVNKTSQGLTSKTSIDYEQVDIKKLVEDQPTMKSYVKDNKITIEGIKAMYTQMGATSN